MSLAFPLGLLGLLTLPAIVLMHLMRERRRRHVVSSLQLWSFLEEEVRGERPQRIPLSPLLLLDLLIAACFTLAWAQPQLEMTVPIPTTRQVILILDVSTSMGAADVSPTRFEQARSEILGQLSGQQDAIFTVITSGSGTRLLGDSRKDERTVIIQRLQALLPGESGAAVEPALASARALAVPGIPVEAHIYTDAAYSLPAGAIPFDLPLRWHRFGTEGTNQAVIGLSGAPAGANRWTVLARFAAFGGQPARREATLLIDGKEVDRASIDLSSGAALTRSWQVGGQPGVITVRLEGQDLLAADDQASISLPAARELRAVLVAADPAPLDRALRALSGVRLKLVSPDEYRPGLEDDLTVFRGVLPEQWPAGTVLVLDPPPDSPLLPVGEAVDITSQPLAPAGSPLAGLDLNAAGWGKTWQMPESPAGLKPLLAAAGQPLVIGGSVGASQVYAVLVDLQSGNLTQQAAFPLMIAALVASADSAGWPGAIRAGEALSFPPAGQYARVQITTPAGQVEKWGSDQPDQYFPAAGPGVYGIETQDENGVVRKTWLGVNAGDLQESDIRPRAEGTDSGQSAQADGGVETRPVSLSPWLLGAALFLLAVEAWLAWR